MLGVRIRPEEVALVAELQSQGFQLQSIWDWVNTPGERPDATSTLLRHLDLATDETLIEGIARALTVKGATEARPGLLAAYERVTSPLVRWAIGQALATIGIRGIESDVIRLAADARFGAAREPLISVLHRVKHPEVEPLLLALLEDERLDYFAATALRYCGSPAALAALERLSLATRSPRTQRGVPKVIAALRLRHGGSGRGSAA